MRILWAIFGTALAAAHPMGNFSVSQYTRLVPAGDRVSVTYIVDLAESPTYDVQSKGVPPVVEWVNHLRFVSGGVVLAPHIDDRRIEVRGGEGGLPALRVTVQLSLAAAVHSLTFEDTNFPGTTGWKEIVIAPAPGTAIVRASHSAADRSNGLTRYSGTPPYDLRASMDWKAGAGEGVIQPITQPQPPPSPKSRTAATPSGGRDYLSTLLGKRDLNAAVILAGLVVAFAFGAVHALSPGHGKTVVAAYLVGSRGTLGHAALLGGMVTFTHTISVFLLGLATLFLSRYIMPERVFPVLGAISGLSIVAVGGWLLYKRIGAMQHILHYQRHDRHHHHHDLHDHHHHQHDHDHEHHHGHQHYIEGDVSVGSLIALGASGGLVPCPSALVLLLSSIALGRIALGLVLLVAFSFGLAIVLMAIGAAVVYAKRLLPDTNRAARHPLFRYVPLLSAGVIVCIGIVMTGVSLGWIRPGIAGS